MLKRLRKLFGREAAEQLVDSRTPPVHHGPKVVHQPIPTSDIDPEAVKIVRRLARFDHTAYLVGGCVRDLLLERKPKDFDIGTTATPRQVKRLFSNCRIIGRRFRLAHVYFQNGKVIEVATFRAHDGNVAETEGAGNGDLLVRDDNVFGTPEEDALRRDFTVNALFYDLNAETVLDHTNGLDDLRRRLIRTIGDPEIRFREDPIRILRAIRFAARLGFSIEPKTLETVKATRNLVPKAAAPRILEEINRFCRGGAARRSFELLRETGVFEVILPSFAEGYQEDPRAWDCLLDLLSAIDERFEAGRDVATGEILAVLLLPLVKRRMGWKEDGTIRPPKGLNIRELADALLVPLAQRLRGPKRDQEHCRQILLTLHRMAPYKRLRRSSEQAVARRPVAPTCQWILETVAHRLGGEFADAARHWAERLKRHEGESRRPGARRTGTGGETRAARRGRRGGRRRSRSRSEEDSAGHGAGAKAKPATARAPRRDLPPPWDDRYFFAALPTVPATAGEEGRALKAAPPAIEAAEAAEQEGAADRADDTSDPQGQPKGSRSRRRRRRRRRKKPTSGDSGDSS